jgi:hypothetical protein
MRSLDLNPPIASNTYESNEFRNAKEYEREYSTSMLRTKCDGSATLLSTPTELVTPSRGENGEGGVVELPEANLDGLLGASAVSEEGASSISTLLEPILSKNPKTFFSFITEAAI